MRKLDKNGRVVVKTMVLSCYGRGRWEIGLFFLLAYLQYQITCQQFNQ